MSNPIENLIRGAVAKGAMMATYEAPPRRPA